MPLRGYICRPCNPANPRVPLDHFDTCKGNNGRPTAPPWLMAFNAKKATEYDLRHQTLDLTATRMMTCPRQTYIEHTFDYWLEPRKVEARSRGSAMHEVAAEHWSRKFYHTESRDPVRCTIEGALNGTRYSMLCDVYRTNEEGKIEEIIDTKFPSDFSIRYRGAFAKVEHAIQLNLARLGLATQEWALKEGYDPNDVMLTIWDHAMGMNEGAKAMPAKHMDEGAILSHRPFGGELTIEQIIQVHQWMIDKHKELEGQPARRETVASSLPLAGAKMMNCKKCMSYCDVEPICSELVRKFGEPRVEW